MAAGKLRTGRLTALVAAFALLGPVAACSGGGPGGEEETGSPSPGRSESGPEPSPSPSSSGKERSPFTGRPGAAKPVLAVKLDNAAAARPHSGLGRADLVYVEQVEGGISRLMAVFSGTLPPDVGPVRSARESDLELLRQFNEPALAYSGVRSALERRVARAPLKQVSPAQAGGAYFRSGSHPVPHNLYARPADLLRAAPGAGRARDVGFTFSDEAPPGGRADGSHTVRYPAASFAFDWSAGQKRWLVSMDGAPGRTSGGGRLGAPTVVLQQVTVRPSKYRDVSGSVTPYIESVGSGKATVLRDGKAYAAKWERKKADGGTTFTRSSDGEPMPFDRGPVWIVYTGR
jgi:hypothetical protein